MSQIQKFPYFIILLFSEYLKESKALKNPLFIYRRLENSFSKHIHENQKFLNFTDQPESSKIYTHI